MNDHKELRRVVKVGGSLFDHLAWSQDVERWLAGQPAATTLIVVGGGRAVDIVLRKQKAHGFSDADAHWWCIRIMSDSGERLVGEMPEWTLVSRPNDLDKIDPGAHHTFVVDALRFMKDVDTTLGERALPESWDVSSDSIAARAAELFAADELVLLKSTLPDDLANLGNYADPYFAEATKHLRAIRFVNLRDPGFPEVRWR
jgi:5-(aminomethyl)-3-furanmethanol phosphate kinase